MHKNVKTIIIKNNIQLSKRKLFRDIITSHFIFKLKNNFNLIILFYVFLPLEYIYIFKFDYIKLQSQNVFHLNDYINHTTKHQVIEFVLRI